MPLIKTSNLTANGSTDGVYCDGGPVWLTAAGTWGAGTLTPYISVDSKASYAPLTVVALDGTLTNVALTQDTALKLDLTDCWVKTVLTGATSPDLDVSLNKPSDKGTN